MWTEFIIYGENLKHDLYVFIEADKSIAEWIFKEKFGSPAYYTMFEYDTLEKATEYELEAFGFKDILDFVCRGYVTVIYASQIYKFLTTNHPTGSLKPKRKSDFVLVKPEIVSSEFVDFVCDRDVADELCEFGAVWKHASILNGYTLRIDPRYDYADVIEYLKKLQKDGEGK